MKMTHDDWGPDLDGHEPTWREVVACIVVAIVIIALLYWILSPFLSVGS